MFQIGHLPVLKTVVDECEIVSLLFDLNLDSVQHTGKIFVCQSASGFLLKQNSDAVGAVCFEGPGGSIRKISEFLCGLSDFFLRFITDVLMVVQGFAHCGGRYIALFRNGFY